MDTVNSFFGHAIDPLSLGGKFFVLILAVLLGGLIGFEREWHGNAAGIRTHILVCAGAAIITITSVEIGMGVRGGMRGDPGHIAAQIVSGIGFLGAGAILREGVNVKGLTTAASIWATAGIGIALGASPRLGELAVLATVVVLGTLLALQPLERLMRLKQTGLALEVDVREVDNGPQRVLELLAEQGITVYGVQTEASSTAPGGTGVMPAQTRHLFVRLRLPRHFDRTTLNRRLLAEPGVISFHLP